MFTNALHLIKYSQDLINTMPVRLIYCLSILQVTGKFRGVNVNNPYNNGCMRNCVYVLCSPKKPRYMHYQVKASNPMANLNHRPRPRPPQASVNRRPDSLAQEMQCVPMYEELDQHHPVRQPPEQNVRSCRVVFLHLRLTDYSPTLYVVLNTLIYI